MVEQQEKILELFFTNLDRRVSICGIDNHEINSISIVTAGGVTQTTSREVIIILHQHTYHGKGKTIHSAGQIKHFKNLVDNRSIKVGGKQYIWTNNGYKIPVSIKDGLPYMPLRPHTDKEWENLPHIVLISDVDWDPTVLDCSSEDCKEWFDVQTEYVKGPTSKLFDEFGNYRKQRSRNYFILMQILFMKIIQMVLFRIVQRLLVT